MFIRQRIIDTGLRIIFLLTFVYSCNVVAESSIEKLDRFYAEEFTKLSERIEPYIQQLDKCLAEMDSFEQGEVLLEPVECPKHNQSREAVADMLNDLALVFDSYGEWLDAIPDSSSIPLATDASGMASASIRIYKLKLHRMQVQTKRVREREKEIVDLIKGLTESLEQQQLDASKEGAETPNN